MQTNKLSQYNNDDGCNHNRATAAERGHTQEISLDEELSFQFTARTRTQYTHADNCMYNAGLPLLLLTTLLRLLLRLLLMAGDVTVRGVAPPPQQTAPTGERPDMTFTE